MGNKGNNTATKPAATVAAAPIAAPVAVATVAAPAAPVAVTLPPPNALPAAAPGMAMQPPRGQRTPGGANKNTLAKSTVANPVQVVWGWFGQLHTANPAITRSQVVAYCVANGVAYHTARTQYQAWRKAGGTGAAPATTVAATPQVPVAPTATA